MAAGSWFGKGSFVSFLRRLWSGKGQRPYQKQPARERTQPLLEILEDRTAPAVFSPTIAAGDSTANLASLRDNIIAANNNADSSNTFNLEAGAYNLTIANTSGQENLAQQGDLDLINLSSGEAATKTYIFQGQGSGVTVIDAKAIDRVFHIAPTGGGNNFDTVAPNITVIFRNLTIQGGKAVDHGTSGNQSGDSDALGGGILNNGGAVTLDNAVVQNNTAQGADNSTTSSGSGGSGRNAQGGGIYSTGGSLTLLNSSSIQNNQALGGKGGNGATSSSGSGRFVGSGGRGGAAQGGGLFTTGTTLTISSSTMQNNTAQGGFGGNGGNGTRNLNGGVGASGGIAQGGGLFASSGSVNISTTIFNANHALGGNGGNGGLGGSSSRNGGPAGNGSDGQGGGLYVTSSSPILDHLTLNANTATGGTGGTGGQGGRGDSSGNGGNGGRAGNGQGGGLYSSNGTFTLTNSTATGNLATGGDGGLGGGGKNSGTNGQGGDGQGGGFYNLNLNLHISSSTVGNNQANGGKGNGSVGAGQGGGLFAFAGQVSIQSSTFSGNQAHGATGFSGGRGQGGGLYNQAAGSLQIHNSTFSGNLAQGGGGFFGGNGEGGAIGIGGENPGLILSNSTLSGNKAIGGNGFGGGEGSPGNGLGGGIYSDFSVTVNNTTIAFNEANGGTTNNSQAGSVNAEISPTLGGFGRGGGYFDDEGDPAAFASTLIAKNTVSGGTNTAGPDVFSFGTIQSNGFNLIGIGDGSQGGFSSASDQVGTAQNPINPLLGPLQNNGGPTATHALLAGSRAINKGANPDNLANDQRGPGFLRTVGGQTDVGAFEVQFGIVLTNFASKVLVLGSNVTPTGQSTLLPDTLYVNGLYHQLLGRAPDQAGVNGWVFLLQAGFSRLQVATALWRSPEHRGIQVDNFYQQLLHRASDPGGRTAWVSAFLAGASENDVARGLLLSPEYQTSHASDTAFVTGLYSDLLGRAPDTTGLNAGVQALGSGTTRAALIHIFLTSPEYEGRVVAQYYVSILGRPATTAEVQAWVTFIQSGGTLETAGELILASNEYFANPI